MAGKYEVDLEDERLKSIQSEQNKKETEINTRYDDMINNTDSYYNNLIDNSKEWAEKQTNIQNQQTDLLVEQTKQQEEKAQKNYTKEQQASYADYMKEVDPYGVRAEQIAANGLKGSGTDESIKARLFTTYQNRVATARASINETIVSFQNSIKEAKLSNSAAIAQIAASAAEQQINLALQQFQYKNTLIESKQNQLNSNADRYNTYYQQVLAQINQEIENKKWIEELKMQQEELSIKKQQALKEIEYISAQIANLNADTAYTKTKTGSEDNSTPQWETGSKTNTAETINATELSKTANKVLIAAKSAGSSSISESILYKAYERQQITKAEADKIASELGL